MQITAPAVTAQEQSDVLRQELILKKALKIEETQQLALVESARVTSPSQPLDTRLVGRLLNEKA
ncbi:hypothetical protein DB347_00790 [Opitutaceae bacterium EW11]|nr:hypothetical protein DB347_00790 [Opitutaceae bacterium EW11]